MRTGTENQVGETSMVFDAFIICIIISILIAFFVPALQQAREQAIIQKEAQKANPQQTTQ